MNQSLANVTVAPYYQIVAQLDLKDSSHNLHAICVIIFSLHLILYVCVQTFDVTACKFLFWELNTALDPV